MTTDQTTRTPVILVVEDEALIRMDVADLLTDAGYRVIAEANADHALTVLQVRSDVDLLFTDVNMPGALDGCDLARIVVARWPDIAIMVTSGMGCPPAGVVPSQARFLPKPCPPAKLLAEISALLRAKPILVPPAEGIAPAGSPAVPTAIKISQLHTGVGVAGGLAQPLSKLEE